MYKASFNFYSQANQCQDIIKDKLIYNVGKYYDTIVRYELQYKQ